MATRKTKPAAGASKSSPKAVVVRHTEREATAAAAGGRSSGQLLREAAWSAMFGRIESKNPFTR